MANLTPEQLDQLEATAKAATPGPWSISPPPRDTGGWPRGSMICTTSGGYVYAYPPGGQYPLADAKHIAAASPDVVLALVEAARKIDRIRAIMDGDGSIMGDRDAIREVLNG